MISLVKLEVVHKNLQYLLDCDCIYKAAKRWNILNYQTCIFLSEKPNKIRVNQCKHFEVVEGYIFAQVHSEYWKKNRFEMHCACLSLSVYFLWVQPLSILIEVILSKSLTPWTGKSNFSLPCLGTKFLNVRIFIVCVQDTMLMARKLFRKRGGSRETSQKFIWLCTDDNRWRKEKRKVGAKDHRGFFFSLSSQKWKFHSPTKNKTPLIEEKFQADDHAGQKLKLERTEYGKTLE